MTLRPVIALLLGSCAAASAAAAAQERQHLSEGWEIQPASQVEASGELVSTPGFSTRGWYPATVPTTVLAALVAADVYPDPYFGMNLRRIPGASYPVGRIFSKLPMPPESPFRQGWWFRTEFEVPAGDAGRSLALHFDGINYRAGVWLNGRRLADADAVAGAYRRYEFDVTELARPGGRNALAVRIFPQRVDDLGLTWVDWNPMAPDKATGLWRDVYLTASGPVALRNPHVVSDLDLPSLDAARLTVLVDARNTTGKAVEGTLSGRIGEIGFSRRVKLTPGETKTVAFAPADHPELVVSRPRLWWPHDMGEPSLQNLELVFEARGAVSDRLRMRFGIREITSELTAEGHRLFRINGRRLLIRGGGWAPDMMLRFSPERARAELDYVRDMGLNTIRLEGKFEPEAFFELADRYGILVMAGWCCCSHWERWQDWRQEDLPIAVASLRSQILRLRGHPSLLAWLNGSDFPPPAEVEKAYLAVLGELRWPNPVVSSATARPAEHSGPSGMKMNGPYEWVPPSYWLEDAERGGAFGFATEVGPGPVPPPLASLRQMLPASSLWPIDEVWSFHAGSGRYRTLDVFTEALNARYGEATGVADYAFKSQLAAYEGLRAMFEAYGRNKYTATGVIQWMLNDAWPSLIWHLYDYYLRPGGAYFGAKKALEPVHVQYSYDDRSVVVVNGRYEALAGLRVSARVYDLEMREHLARTRDLAVPADSSTRAFTVPEPGEISRTYFLSLALHDAAGTLVSSNFYWLSTAQDVLDWDASTWYHTPARSFADFTALAELPPVELRVKARHSSAGEDSSTRVTVENPTAHLAFAVRLTLTRGENGREVLPILWQDNYFALLPGESREIVGGYRTRDLEGGEPVVVVDGWNVSKARPRP